jgi:hypothetical protein
MKAAFSLLKHRHLTTSLGPAIGLHTTSNPSLSYRRFTKSSTSLMPTSLTREMLIWPDYAKVAAARPTMFQFGEDGEGIIYPSTVFASLKKKEIVTVE